MNFDVIHISVNEAKERLKQLTLVDGDQYGTYLTSLEHDHIEAVVRELAKPSVQFPEHDYRSPQE